MHLSYRSERPEISESAELNEEEMPDTGRLLHLRCGHGGSFGASEREMYEMHLKFANFI